MRRRWRPWWSTGGEAGQSEDSPSPDASQFPVFSWNCITGLESQTSNSKDLIFRAYPGSRSLRTKQAVLLLVIFLAHQEHIRTKRIQILTSLTVPVRVSVA